MRKSLICAVVVIVLASCGGGQGGPAPTDYQTLVNNAGEYYENQTEIEVQGQIVELVESADYAELGEVTKPDADVVLTVESFLLNLGDPLPDPTLKKLHKVFTEDGVFGDDAGTVLKDTGEDLDLVLVRWTAPPDIPQRKNLMADPYPVTPGTEVTVQGVLTSDQVETWRHCRTFRSPYGDHVPCTNIANVSGLRMEASRVADVDAARFGFATGTLGD